MSVYSSFTKVYFSKLNAVITKFFTTTKFFGHSYQTKGLTLILLFISYYDNLIYHSLFVVLP